MKGSWGRAMNTCLDWLGNPPPVAPTLSPTSGNSQVVMPHWDLVTLTLALGEAGAGLVALITDTMEAAHGVDAAAVGTGAGLGTAFIII